MLLVVIIILLLNIVRFLHAEILELFNARYKEEKGKKGSNIFLLLGILLIIVAVIVMLYAYNFEKNIYMVYQHRNYYYRHRNNVG